jgi:hypothetical protein
MMRTVESKPVIVCLLDTLKRIYYRVGGHLGFSHGKTVNHILGVVVHICNPSTQEAEGRESQVGGQPGPCLKTTITKLSSGVKHSLRNQRAASPSCSRNPKPLISAMDTPLPLIFTHWIRQCYLPA